MPDETKKMFNFDFLVEGLTDEQAEKLFTIIVAFVEACSAKTVGTFTETSDEKESSAAS